MRIASHTSSRPGTPPPPGVIHLRDGRCRSRTACCSGPAAARRVVIDQRKFGWLMCGMPRPRGWRSTLRCSTSTTDVPPCGVDLALHVQAVDVQRHVAERVGDLFALDDQELLVGAVQRIQAVHASSGSCDRSAPGTDSRARGTSAPRRPACCRRRCSACACGCCPCTTAHPVLRLGAQGERHAKDGDDCEGSDGGRMGLRHSIIGGDPTPRLAPVSHHRTVNRTSRRAAPREDVASIVSRYSPAVRSLNGTSIRNSAMRSFMPKTSPATASVRRNRTVPCESVTRMESCTVCSTGPL